MIGIGTPHTRGVSVLCCALLATSLHAQGVKPAVGERYSGRPGVQQMEIYNGATRTVRYFDRNLSPSESSMLREMERLENEAGYVGDLQALKRQYVASERLTELNRRIVQLSLYGRELSRTSYATTYADYGYPSYGYGAYRAAGFYGYPYGGNGYANSMAVGGASATEKYSLANGVGPQGAITDALAGVLAQQSTPEYAASVERAYDRVAMRASASPDLRAAMRLPDPAKYRYLDAPAGRYTVTLKDGEKIYGKSMSEDKDMYVIETAGDGKTRVLKSEVKRIDDAGSGFKPAADR